jgi:tetratricopeptide (TPR) repeat protein
MPTRREKIEAMLQVEPQDEFLRYSLAVEYDNEGRWEESLAIFQGLMRQQPPHVPSFFRCAQMLVRLGQIEAARRILREGIEVARQQQELHAAGEMGELLASLGSVPES